MNPATKRQYFLNPEAVSFSVNPPTQGAPTSNSNHNASEKTPNYSPHDISLQEMQRRGIVDEKGMVHHAKLPEYLPQIPPHIQGKFFTLFTGTYPVTTKDKAHSFPLNIALLIQNALSFLSPSVSLTGGGVYALLDIKYVKSTLDLVDPELFDSLPMKCYAPFGAAPNDFDFRINPNRELSKKDLEEIRANILKIFYNCFNSRPVEQRNWENTESYVTNNCFKNLDVVFNSDNRFSLVAFSGTAFEVDLMFIQKLDIDFLFRHNSMKLALEVGDFGYFVKFAGEVRDCFQSIFDKLNKIIHANTIKEKNFKVWFVLLQLHSSFYRSYETGLEKVTVKNAMKALREMRLKENETPLSKCCDLLTKTLHNNLDKNGDLAAQFCLFMNACRSLLFHEEESFAAELYATIQEKFPKNGLPSLFQPGDSLEQHFSLLQLFGVLAHDGETICYTLDDFEPALQFIVEGEEKSFSLLVPLQLEKALKTTLETCDTKMLKRYFAFFFPNKKAPFCEKPLQLEISEKLLKQGLNHPHLKRLFHYLTAGFTSHLDTDLLDLDKPTPHQLVVLENYLKRFSQNISFAPLYETEWDLAEFIKALLLSNHPAISEKAFEIWTNKSSEPDFIPRTQKLTQSIPNSRWRIKLFKLAPSDKQTPSFIPYFKQKEGLNHLGDFIEWILDHPEFATNEIDNLAELCLEKFGLNELTYKLLTKAKGAKVGPAFQQAAKRLSKPEDLKKAWEVGKTKGFFNQKEEALFFFRMIPLFLKSDQEEAAKLLQELKQEHLDRKQKQEVKRWMGELRQNPSINLSLLLAEIDSAIQKNDFSKAHTLLVNLISQNPDNKKEVTTRLLKLPSLPQTLLTHPQISAYLSSEKLVEELLKLNLIGETLPYFPVDSETLNHEVITQVLTKKVKKIDTHKIFSYLLDHNEEKLLKKWISVYPPQELTQDEIEKLLNLQPEAFSSLLRKHTTKETLRAYKETYKTYIPNTSQEEKTAWITLILEKNAATFFPILEWMEETTPTIKQLTLFAPELLNTKEKERFIELLKRHPIKKADLDALLPIYIQFKQMTPSIISTFVKEATKANSEETKLAVWNAFEGVSKDADTDTWMSAIKLLKQLKSEKIFKYIKREASFPKDPHLAKAIANGAAEQINPSTEQKRLEQISAFHDEHHLTEEMPVVTLYADSGHPPLLLKALEQFLKWKLKKRKEQLPLLKIIAKNIPQDKENPSLDETFKAVIDPIQSSDLSDSEDVQFLEVLTTHPDIVYLRRALNFLNYLLANRTDIKKINTDCLQLGIESMDPYSLVLVENILALPSLEGYIKYKEITNLQIDLIENKLRSYIEAPDLRLPFESIDYFVALSEQVKDLARKKKLLFLSLDALMAAPLQTLNSNDFIVYITKLMLAIVEEKPTPSKQAIQYCLRQNMIEDLVPLSAYKDNPNDLFYEFSKALLDKSLEIDPSDLDQSGKYFSYILYHLSELFIAYPENVEAFIDPLYRYVFLQLPSGDDLSEKILKNKFELLQSLLKKSPPSPDKISKVIEMAFVLSNRVTAHGVTPEVKKAAFKKAFLKLINHPSIQGVHRAFALYGENSDLMQDKELFEFFWDEISKAILARSCEEIGTFHFVQNYCFLLVQLTNKILAKKLFQEFREKIEKEEVSKESLALLSNFKFSNLNQ